MAIGRSRDGGMSYEGLPSSVSKRGQMNRRDRMYDCPVQVNIEIHSLDDDISEHRSGRGNGRCSAAETDEQ